MLNIVICEDDNIQRSTIEKFIKNSIAKNDYSYLELNYLLLILKMY